MPSRTRRPAKDDGEDITVNDAPTSIDPYAILGIDKDATSSQITSAYRKAALKCHPDKVAAEDKDTAHAKFQEVAFAYAILSDERRRKRYDTTGRTEESLDLDDDDFDWTDFFRNQYKDVVTAEKIDDFARSYKGSEEERGHVLQAYKRVKGNMDKLYNEVMLSDVLEDDDRFRAIIDAAIASGEVEALSGYTGETEKKRKARTARAEKKKVKDAKEAEEAQRELEESGPAGKASAKTSKKKGAAGGGDLAALIQARQQSRTGAQESFFDRLEAKYAPQGQKGRKRASEEEPPEEAFAANRKAGKESEAKAGVGKSKRVKK